jgi:hypothetical protein
VRWAHALHHRNGMVSEALHEHAASLAPGFRNRSRRSLTNLRKILDTTGVRGEQPGERPGRCG